MRSRPATASGGPPRTGASIRVTSRGSLLATDRIASGPTVDISISHCPGVSAATTPLSANSTCCSACGVASMVMTASAPVTASAGDEAAAAPWSINGAVLLLVRFQTVTSWPASSSRVAIGVPISPRPRNASLLIECSVLGVTCLGLQSPYGHGVVARTTSSRGTSSRPRASPCTPCLSSRLAWIHAAGEPEALDSHQQGFPGPTRDPDAGCARRRAAASAAQPRRSARRDQGRERDLRSRPDGGANGRTPVSTHGQVRTPAVDLLIMKTLPVGGGSGWRERGTGVVAAIGTRPRDRRVGGGGGESGGGG